MRTLLTAIWLIALTLAIVVACLSGFIGISVMLEAGATCPDANQCSDAVAAFPIYLGLSLVSGVAAFLISRVIARRAQR